MPIVAAACWLARQCPPYTLVKPRSSSGERQSRWCAVQGGFPTWAQTAWAPTRAASMRLDQILVAISSLLSSLCTLPCLLVQPGQ